MNSRVKTLSGVVAEVTLSVSASSGLDVGKLSEKSTQDCGGSFVCIQNRKNGGVGALWEDEVGKMCTRLQRELDLRFKMLTFGMLLEDEVGKILHQSVARARFHIKIPKNLRSGELCFFGRGKVASGVAEVGCLFPRFRGSI